MHILYVDEAGNTGTDYDNPQQPIFSLSGIIVDTDDWIEYNWLIPPSLLTNHTCIESLPQQ